MRRSAILATLTCMAFVWATLWPDVARARENQPPPPATAATPAADDPTMASAKQHFAAGRAAYTANDFPTAIREFKAAEALRPSPVLAYNIGLANEKLGRRKVAVKYYQRYLETSPKAANRAEVEGRISSLEAQLGQQPPPTVQQPDSSQDNPPPPMMDGNNQPPPMIVGQDPYAAQPPGMTAPPHKKKRSLWWVGLIVGLGVAVIVTVIVVSVIYTHDAASTVYYDAKVPSPVDGTHLLDRAVVPSQAHGAETAPLYQVHF
ncbi:MAG: tetratricopeptide repeat protein [Polyangia bacterium]